MKLYVALVHVVAFLVFAGSTLGEGEGDLAQPRSCPVTIDEGEEMSSKIAGLGLKCLNPTGNDAAFILSSKTLEENKDFFKEYCQKQLQIRECLADVALTSRACQDEKHHQLFQVYRELLENTLDAGCVQDGEVVANMITIYKEDSTSSSNQNHLKNCLSTLIRRVQLSTRMEVSDFSRMYIFYNDVEQAKACIDNKKKGEQQLAGRMVTLLYQILGKLKCFHPQDDSVLLCMNLDPHGISLRSICPIKSKDELNKPLYGLLIDRLPVCIMAADIYEDPGMTNFENPDETRTYFKNLCAKERMTFNCLREVTYLSSECLDTDQDTMLTAAYDFITNLIEHICMEDGVHFANVMYNVMNNVDNKTERTVLRDCGNIAHTPGEAIDTNLTSAKTLKYYHEFKVFKGCVLNKLKGGSAESSAELILNGMLNNMKCINTEETYVVPCETVISGHPTTSYDLDFD